MTENEEWESGAEWEEDRLPSRTADMARNHLSFPVSGDFYKATKDALLWQLRGEEDPGRAAVPSTFIENLFKKAAVPYAQGLTDQQGDHKFLTRCLGLKEYMGRALDLLVEHGLLKDEDDEPLVLVGDEVMTELSERADKLVTELKDEDILLVKETSWDWTHGYNEGLQLLQAHEITLIDLTEKTKDLSLYCELAKIAGPERHRRGANGPNIHPGRLRTGKTRYIFSDTFSPDTSAIQRDTSYSI